MKTKKAKYDLKEVKALLDSSGLSRQALMNRVNKAVITRDTADCGLQCSGGCDQGCHSCSPGNSNKCVTKS